MSSLITLPIRLPLEITWRAAKLGVGVLRTVTGLLEHDEADQRVAPVAQQPAASPPPAPMPAPPPATPMPPRHIDTDPVLAYESGPGDDVGAEVHVDAPWDGYDRMRARDIVDRLQVADEATRAVVRLYEQQGKARSSVIAATG